jgi:hypothetical protein
LNLGGSSSSTSNSSSMTPNPITSTLFNPIWNAATADVSTPYQPYTGELYPGLTSGQLQATQMANANLGAGQDTLSGAISSAQGLTNYAPQQVSAPTMTAAQAGPTSLTSATGYGASLGSAANAGPAALSSAAQIDPSSVGDVNAGLLANTDLSPYLDPATQDVINSTLAQMEQQRGQAIANTQGQFTQGGAFGGSREGVADALTNQYYGGLEGQQAAQLYSQAFQNAQSQAQTDLSRQLTAGQANQSKDLSIAGQNAGYDQQTGLANASALNQNAQYNASNQQATSAANAAALNAAAQFGAGAQNAASSQNAGAQNATSQFNAGLAQQAAANNAQMGLTSQQLNQAAGLQAAGLGLSASQALAAMGAQQQNMGLANVNAIDQLGTQAQQTQAAQDQAALQQYMLAMQYPFMQAQAYQGLLGDLGALFSGASTKGTGKQSGMTYGMSIPLYTGQ